MSATAPVNGRNQSTLENIEGLDVDWLLHSKKDFPAHVKDNARSKQDVAAAATSLPNIKTDTTSVQTTPVASPAQTRNPATIPDASKTNSTNGSTGRNPVGTQAASTISQKVTPRGPSVDEGKANSRTSVGGLKKESRRSSWITNLGHKLSGGSAPARTPSIDSSKSKSPMNSPRVETGNPFDRKSGQRPEDKKEPDTDPPVYVPQSPRRPSVLVAAGTETRTEHPGFLTSALRRLSSSSAVTLGKATGSGAMLPRKIMNVDHNRERVRIAEFDQNKLKRVAFCVDVEIAGISAQGEEEHTNPTDAVGHNLPTSNLSQNVEPAKDSKQAKYKEKGEGAALKNPTAASQEKDQIGKTKTDEIAEAKEAVQKSQTDGSAGGTEGNSGDPLAPPTTRKKEKKKRSEAERKERKERKRKHAEANGLVPLELTRDDDDSDSSPSNTPPGASTPRTNADQPTTDPLRIYKRCCQLRETTALNVVKDQINKPSATLAEALGTVAVLDLSGTTMSLQEITTLGDWLAVVPVRKLIMNDCNLGDEALRIILSGLASCKTAEQARQNRKLPKRGSGKNGREQMGVIEKLSLKNNRAITSIGWKHIALFIHLSRALVAIDLTGIPFASPSSKGNSGPTSEEAGRSSGKINSLVARAISERLGDKLEELILSGCDLSTDNISDFVSAAIKCRIRRLGLAGNNLNHEGLEHIVRYIKSGICEGLDLGSNDLHGAGNMLFDSLDKSNPLFALSLADCDLTPNDLNDMLPRFTVLENFKFIDLSRNHALFSEEKTAVPIFRKVLPKMKILKRIHLADVGMNPYHVIAISEVFPDCTSLAHINILENESLVNALNARSADLQEEAAAFLASLMTAVRVSDTIVAIEVEVPSSDTSEVVRALSSQIVAYSLRNMEKSALNEYGVQPQHSPDKDAPEVLLHLVGHMDGYSENHDADEPAPDDDYLIASTGIAKALRVCLGSKDGSHYSSRNPTPTASGTATPRHAGPLRPLPRKKPRDVSFELCESARKIRMRLRPALVKEDRAGNNENYRRLAALDSTLERIIQRFEDEYPEARPNPNNTSPRMSGTSPDYNSPLESPDISRVTSRTDASSRIGDDSDAQDPYAIRLSRTASNTSLARALTHEEGRMHRFGQSIRRQVLAPTGTDDYEHGTSINDKPEPEYLAALRVKLEQLKGEDIRQRVNEFGADEVIREIGVNAEELKALKFEDPEGFEAFKSSQLAAQVNQGLIDEEEKRKLMSNTISSATTTTAPTITYGSPSAADSSVGYGQDQSQDSSTGPSLYSQVTG